MKYFLFSIFVLYFSYTILLILLVAIAMSYFELICNVSILKQFRTIYTYPVCCAIVVMCFASAYIINLKCTFVTFALNQQLTFNGFKKRKKKDKLFYIFTILSFLPFFLSICNSRLSHFPFS